ncbi:MAG TPA: ribosome silencing factor [Acidimicrobiales bacterium]|nr:ribosome silencing factor [Acidimicrobiales bacterium]
MTTAAARSVAVHTHSGVPDDSLLAARAADSKLAERTVILSVGEALGITEAFVITSGANARQVRTIADEVELQLKKAEGRAPDRIEGLDDARWVLMDYGDFIAHVFLQETREYYDLEHLWADAPRVAWS